MEWLFTWFEFKKLSIGELLTAIGVWAAFYQFWKSRRMPITEKALIYAKAFETASNVLVNYSAVNTDAAVQAQLERLRYHELEDTLLGWSGDRYIFVKRLSQIDIDILDVCYTKYKSLINLQAGYRMLRESALHEKSCEIQRELVHLAFSVVDTAAEGSQSRYDILRPAAIDIAQAESYSFDPFHYIHTYSSIVSGFHSVVGTTALANLNTIASRRWWWRLRTTSIGT